MRSWSEVLLVVFSIHQSFPIGNYKLPTHMKPFRADILHTEDLRLTKRRRLWLWLISGMVFACVAGLVAGERYVFNDIPTLPEDLSTLWSVGKEPSFVLLDNTGQVLARRGPRYGKIIAAKEMPKLLVQAFLAIEDQRFYQHSGIDQKGIFRAAIANWQAGKTTQGASTITQQLIKRLLLTPDRTFKRKLQEIRLAQELEKSSTKDEILSLYLNRIYLGNRAYGVTAAANRYFGKSLGELNLSEIAMLAALPKAPSRFAPHLNLQPARERAALVLQAMLEQNYIDPAQQQAALAAPATPISDKTEPDHGYIFDLAVERALKITGGRIPDLVIQTTIDRSLQQQAEKHLHELIQSQGSKKNVSQGALISMNRSGAIQALVGGVSYQKSKFNRAVSAKRQPGSAFKAFVYGAALEAGLRPASVRRDEPIEIAGWSPGNYNEDYRGRVTIREAFRRSINTVSAQVTDEIGAAKVAVLATRFGISGPLQALPSIALGAQEVSLWELTQAFSVFGNDGMLHHNYLIEQITTSAGQSLYQRPTVHPQKVFDQELSRQMTGMMQEVVLSGTGRRANLPDRQVAGKTGTSQQWRDAWFVGFSAQFTTGVWLGNDDNSAMKKVTGGTLPAQIWRSFMLDAHAKLPNEPLNMPPPQILSETDEGLASFYSELAALFDDLAPEPP